MDQPNATDAADTADSIREAGEAEEVKELVAREEQRSQGREKFRQRAALAIASLAMLLAISSLAGGNATKNMLNANIQASDTYSFYQAKNIRQTSYRLQQEELELLLPTLPAEQQALARQRIESYKATVARYESEPQTGEGKTELLAKADAFVKDRDRAARQDPYFDFSSALFQIAIVLGSLSIVAASRLVLAGSLGLGAIATLLMLNGFLLLVDLPIG
ncbi:MAG TPA: DUF4337 domain-containing protein [Chloroflexota bacterium]|jgi:hypothetical protein